MGGALTNDIEQAWNFSDPTGSEARFRELLLAAQASEDRSAEAQILTQIARAQGLQRKFDDAHATLDRAETLTGDTPLPRVRCLLERGRVFNSSGSADKAAPLFRQAFDAASASALDALAIDAAHMIAIVETGPAAQLEWNLRAIDLAERSADERAQRWRASLYNNIGWTYFEQKRYDDALAVFEKAVTLRAAQQKPRELHIALYCVAKTYRMQRRFDDAIAINRRIVAEAEQADEPDGYFLEELAECLLATGKPDEARPFFREAFEQLSKDPWLAKNEPQRLKRLDALSR